MTEIGRQQRHSGLHVATVAIPAEQGRDGEAMSKIMWPRSTPRGASAQAGLSDEVKPGEVGVAVQDPRARHGHEERRVDRPGAETITFAGVGAERGDGGVVKWDLS